MPDILNQHKLSHNLYSKDCYQKVSNYGAAVYLHKLEKDAGRCGESLYSDAGSLSFACIHSLPCGRCEQLHCHQCSIWHFKLGRLAISVARLTTKYIKTVVLLDWCLKTYNLIFLAPNRYFRTAFVIRCIFLALWPCRGLRGFTEQLLADEFEECNCKRVIRHWKWTCNE